MPSAATTQPGRNEPRRKARIACDVPKAARGTIVVADEIQIRVVNTDHPVPPRAKATSILCHRAVEHAERCAVSGGQNDAVERLFLSIAETHTLGRELQ
jgi:hypothetical protein